MNQAFRLRQNADISLTRVKLKLTVRKLIFPFKWRNWKIKMVEPCTDLHMFLDSRYSLVSLKARLRMRFFYATFLALFSTMFFAWSSRKKNRLWKLAAISIRLLCDLSPGSRSGFEDIGNLMQLSRDYGKCNKYPTRIAQKSPLLYTCEFLKKPWWCAGGAVYCKSQKVWVDQQSW